MKEQALDLLLTRRSVKAELLTAPAPSAQQLKQILTAGARVPDHGKTMPFYFMTFQGQERIEIGAHIAAIFKDKNPEAAQDKIDLEYKRFTKAPLVIAVIYRKRRAKHPLWEQIMSVGATCQNILLAAHALGFAGQWLSEWYAYDAEFHKILGLDERDNIAGFIHIGTPPEGEQDDRDRPDLAEISTRWSDVQQGTVRKGDCYDRDKLSYPALGALLRDC